MSSLQSPQIHWADLRRHELDWLRVLAFGLLIIYHLGMAYVADWGWHIKSAYQSETLQYLMRWSNQWRMSLLFLISGAALSYQLYRHSGWAMPGRLCRRLLLPLVVGSLVVVAPQSFVESKLAGAIGDMSYLEFWRHYLGYPWGFGDPLPPAYGRLPGFNAIWNHLWYLPYLLAYSLLVWAIYPLLCRPRVARTAQTLGQSMPLMLLYILPCLLIFALGQWLWEKYPTTHAFFNDWHNHARSFSIFLVGFGLVRSQRLWQSLGRLRHLSLSLAVICYGLISFYVEGGQLGSYLPWLVGIEGPLRGFVWSANIWLWIMAILGYAQVWLSRPSPLIQAANRGVYCWYILHQTFIVLGVYWLRNYQLGPVWEPLCVAALTLAGCALGYGLLRRIPGVRLAFGVTSGHKTATRGLVQSI